MTLSLEEKEKRKQERYLEYYNRTYKEVEGILYKRCPKCEKWFVENKDNFYYQNEKSTTSCKKCDIKRAYKRVQEYPDIDKLKKAIRIEQEEYRHRPENIIKKREASTRRRENGKQGEWQQNNPDKLKGYGKIYSDKKHNINNKEWVSCKNYFNNTCAYCGLPIEEHFTKYRGITKQGDFHKEHVNCDGEGNLQNCVPSCKFCNTSKHKENMEEWYSKQTFFNQERLDKIHNWINEDYKEYAEIKLK